MTLPTHLVDTLGEAAPGATVVVEGDEAHHAVAVRRLRAGRQLLDHPAGAVDRRQRLLGEGDRSTVAGDGEQVVEGHGADADLDGRSLDGRGRVSGGHADHGTPAGARSPARCAVLCLRSETWWSHLGV